MTRLKDECGPVSVRSRAALKGRPRAHLRRKGAADQPADGGRQAKELQVSPVAREAGEQRTEERAGEVHEAGLQASGVDRGGHQARTITAGEGGDARRGKGEGRLGTVVVLKEFVGPIAVKDTDREREACQREPIQQQQRARQPSFLRDRSLEGQRSSLREDEPHTRTSIVVAAARKTQASRPPSTGGSCEPGLRLSRSGELARERLLADGGVVMLLLSVRIVAGGRGWSSIWTMVGRRGERARWALGGAKRVEKKAATVRVRLGGADRTGSTARAPRLSRADNADCWHARAQRVRERIAITWERGASRGRQQVATTDRVTLATLTLLTTVCDNTRGQLREAAGPVRAGSASVRLSSTAHGLSLSDDANLQISNTRALDFSIT